MNYRTKTKIHDFGIVEFFPDRIVLATTKSDPGILAVCDADLNFLWKSAIARYASYIPVSECECITCEDHQSTFINLLNGQTIAVENNKKYLAKAELYKVTFDVNSGETITIEFPDRTIEVFTGNINDITFLGNYIVQSYYNEKTLKCYDLQSGNTIWKLDYKELLQSERADLSSQIVDHNGYLFFYLTDLRAKKRQYSKWSWQKAK